MQLPSINMEDGASDDGVGEVVGGAGRVDAGVASSPPSPSPLDVGGGEVSGSVVGSDGATPLPSPPLGSSMLVGVQVRGRERGWWCACVANNQQLSSKHKQSGKNAGTKALFGVACKRRVAN